MLLEYNFYCIFASPVTKRIFIEASISYEQLNQATITTYSIALVL